MTAIPTAVLERRIQIRASSGWAAMPYVCLLVSCGRPAHEGADLKAAMTKMREAGKPILIDFADTLQRHNFMAHGMDDTDAYMASLKAGDDWIARHKDILGDARVLRWDERLAHRDFPEVHEQLWRLYQREDGLRRAVDADMEKFLSRQANPLPGFADHSRRFLLEEMACFIVFGRDYPCTTFYPGKELETMRVLRAREIPDVPWGLEHNLRYSFTLKTVQRPALAAVESQAA